MSPKLSILILNYNTKDATSHCIVSIVNNYKNELEKGEIELLVLDNGSHDDSYKVIKELEGQIPSLTIFRSNRNLGFGKGHNFLATKVKGTCIFLLNSDTKLIDKGLLEMVEFMVSHPKVGVLGAQLRSEQHKIEDSARKFYVFPYIIFALFGGEHFSFTTFPKSVSKVDWVSGGAMMVEKKLFDELGGFDEHFFMYLEDMEFCYRVNKMGKQVFFYPHIQIIHYKHASSNKEYAILNVYKGLLYFFRKQKPPFEYMLVRMLLLFKAVIAVIIGGVLGKKDVVSTYRKAINIVYENH